MWKIGRVKYLLGTMLLNLIIFGIVPNLLSDYFKENIPYLAALMAGMVLSYAIIGLLVRFFENRSRVELNLSQKENPDARRGLIVLMSPGPRTTAAENAVKAHLSALKQCWVIYGPDRPGQKPTPRENAQTLEEKFKSVKKDTITFHLKAQADEHDPQESYYLVRSIYEEAKAVGLSETDVIADYTGGTKSMTAGMVLACSVSEERDAEYMRATKTSPSGVAEPATEAIPVSVNLKFGGQVG